MVSLSNHDPGNGGIHRQAQDDSTASGWAETNEVHYFAQSLTETNSAPGRDRGRKVHSRIRPASPDVYRAQEGRSLRSISRSSALWRNGRPLSGVGSFTSP